MACATRMRFVVSFVILLAACNQPFDPVGPLHSKLSMYGILNSQSDTQYVIVSTTFQQPPPPEVRNASVVMLCDDQRITFHDTTIQQLGLDGVPVPIPVYVAYRDSVKEGALYQLRASIPEGLEASANATALGVPSVELKTPIHRDTAQKSVITFRVTFKTITGACIPHFYLDYYALVNEGWEFHREEVALTVAVDGSGNQVLEFPRFTLVKTLTGAGKTANIEYDPVAYGAAWTKVAKRYLGGTVVFFQVEFELTQIDDVLFTYYYLNNGPQDVSTIRLDKPDYTNIRNGVGVFGSRAYVRVARLI